MTEQLTLADAGRASDPRKQKVPGATPFVPQIPEDAPQYLVVDQPYFNGRLYEVGEIVRTDAVVIKELGSPGRCLKPLGHQGPWPPRAFVEAEARAKKRAREEWVKDLRRG